MLRQPGLIQPTPAGQRSRRWRQAMGTSLAVAAGHLASVGLVAATVLFDLAIDRGRVQALAGGLLLLAVVLCVAARRCGWRRAPSGPIGLALGSFMMSTAHGAGLMLVPALAPLCFSGDAPGQAGAASDSLAPALAALGLHTAAMPLAAGVIALGARSGFDLASGWLARLRSKPRSGSGLR